MKKERRKRAEGNRRERKGALRRNKSDEIAEGND